MANGQDISYSKINRSEIAGEMNFDIIGKLGKNYLIYKWSKTKKILEVLDENMKRLSYSVADFLPKNLATIMFVPQSSYVTAIYQYEKANQLLTEAIKLNEYGKAIGEIILLENEAPAQFIYSDNKQRILLYYFGENDNGRSVIKTKLFDADFNLLDEHSSFVQLNFKEEVYDNFLLTNEGAFSFVIKRMPDSTPEYVNQLDVLLRKPKTVQFVRIPLLFQNQYVNAVDMIVNNANEGYLINSFFYPEKNSPHKTGMFTAIMDGKNYGVNSNLIYFNNNQLKISDTANPAVLFKNFELQHILLKKDGSFIAIAENLLSYKRPVLKATPLTQIRSIARRRGSELAYLSYMGYVNGNQESIVDVYRQLENAKEILIFDINNKLELKKADIINKEQKDGEQDFQSYGMLKKGSDLEFLYIDNLKNPEIVFSRIYTADGSLNRNATLRSGQKGYKFMPRYIKQVAANEVLIPTSFKGRIAFAKLTY